MKEKLLIFLALALLIIILIGLNAASYVQKEQIPDSEASPNRSTYNIGATGTRAFYDFLAETGHQVTRWQDVPPSSADFDKSHHPQTFVIIGQIRREFEDREISNLLAWVYYDGGRLVIIDRSPPEKLLATASDWRISTILGDVPFLETDPANLQQMTLETAAAKPVQPTLFTDQVSAVQTSRFASSVAIDRISAEEEETFSDEAFSDVPTDDESGENQTPVQDDDEITDEETESAPGPGLGSGQDQLVFPDSTPDSTEPSSMITDEVVPAKPPLTAPVIHLSDGTKNILAHYPYGAGQIVFLTDPYIVSNGGIGLVDNALLASNVVARSDGLIAFDEYHQGFGAGNNLLISYFSGTPVVAFFLQLAALIAFVFYSQSRRFARPLPAAEPNRLSKLEYVGAMAALQQRTKAFDLAIENIYKDFRRRVSKMLGVDNFITPRGQLAKLISERSRLSSDEIDELMFKCEDITHGEKTNKRETVQLIGRLRELENEIGLRRNKRSK